MSVQWTCRRNYAMRTLTALYETRGGDVLTVAPHSITILHHALRTASLARENKASPHLVSSALLHRVGSLLTAEMKASFLPDSLPPTTTPEWIGSEYLALLGFSSSVSSRVRDQQSNWVSKPSRLSSRAESLPSACEKYRWGPLQEWSERAKRRHWPALSTPTFSSFAFELASSIPDPSSAPR